ncbi:MAG: hypothetical protein KBT12_03805 [Bacteroidales bacterium]|nr:hypothetical protein [Candidatus Physcousia equi]
MAQEDLKVKNNSVEIGFNPFSNNFLTFRIDELKYRHFWGNNALRVKVGLGINGINKENKKDTEQFSTIHTYNGETTDINPTITPTATSSIQKVSGSVSNFNLSLGYERHFDVARRVNLYVGAEVGFGMQTVSATEEGENTDIKTTNFSQTNSKTLTTVTNVTNYKNEFKKAYEADQAWTSIGMSIFTGIDFYVYKGLYLGAELGLGFNHVSFKNPELISNSTSTETTDYKYQATNSENSYSTKKVITVNESYDSTTGISTKNTTAVYTTTQKNAKGETSSTSETNKKCEETTLSNNSFKLYAEPALRIGWRF